MNIHPEVHKWAGICTIRRPPTCAQLQSCIPQHYYSSIYCIVSMYIVLTMLPAGSDVIEMQRAVYLYFLL